jgi:hypothetical protein
MSDAPTAQNSGATGKLRAGGRPFVKGQSGNPGGRPKKADSPTAELRRILQLIDEATGKRNSTRVAETLLAAALKGNIEAIKYLFDRIDGRPVDAQPAASEDTQVNVYINGIKLGGPAPDDLPALA